MRFSVFLASFLTISIPLSADQTRVQVLIEQNTEVGRFQDALYYPLDTFPGTDSKKVQDDRSVRIASFVDAVKNPPIVQPPPEKSKDELLKRAADLQESLAATQAELADVNAKLAAK